MNKTSTPKGKGKKKGPTYDFDNMQPGDSFFYQGPRSGPIVAFGYRAIKGCFTTEKETTTDAAGNVIKGWRFLLKRDPTKG